ncbi:cytochrome c oxidase subunit 4 [Glaciihabitans sp. UYNi722]|uniref:cytochrome c oxidase subunit 4 n=1 Tax=Glaciihabitans sp. UYNi722 TaxID=3156344 RepID=UPI0033994E02
MNTNAKMFTILGGFFVLADATYVIWSLVDPLHLRVEWVGTVGLGLAAILAFFIAFYLGRSHHSVGGELPEDRLDADIDDGDPEQGFFSPWSWWPIMLAGGAALLFMGIAIGIWIAFIGVAVTAISLVGWVYEYYRGNFAR